MAIVDHIFTMFLGKDCLVIKEVYKNGNTVFTAIPKGTNKPIAKITLYEQKKIKTRRRNKGR